MIAILVPVLGRPQQIKPLLENITSATDLEHRVVFICSPDDKTRLICKKTKAQTIVVPWEPDRADFAKKINHAYELVEEEYLFQAATDLVFHEGWASQVVRTAAINGVGVVGTNDLGNPSVKKGGHSTHILFTRSYIDTFGGTYDNTGTVFSEAYSHQFVDTEFVQTAMLRRQFKPCLKSIVEHMHPHWGKGEMDSTYEKSELNFLEDAKIFNNRMRQIRRRPFSQ